MKTLRCECDRFERIVRWLARGTSVAAIGLFTLFAVGEGLPNPLRQPWPVRIELSCFLGIMAGLILAWGWEGLGGLIAVASFALFQSVEMVVNHRPAVNGAFGLLGLPGVLFLIVAIWRRLHQVVPPSAGAS